MGSSLRPWAPAPTPPWVPTLGPTPRVLLLLPLWVLALGSTSWVLTQPPWSPGRGGRIIIHSLTRVGTGIFFCQTPF